MLPESIVLSLFADDYREPFGPWRQRAQPTPEQVAKAKARAQEKEDRDYQVWRDRFVDDDDTNDSEW